jgi:hypothetical protein
MKQIIQMHDAWPFETADVARFLGIPVKNVLLGSGDGL